MNVSLEQLDSIMERASHSLAAMDYLECEALCVEALRLARASDRFGYYARVLLPLQEARRQRRMIAVAGQVQVDTADGFDPDAWLDGLDAGCLVLTRPHTADGARTLESRARHDKQFVEILYADSDPSDPVWTLRSYAGPEVCCEVPAPTPETDAARWFIDATERLGDAALAGVDDALARRPRFDELEARLLVFPDHELLHQHLADAARAVR
jgi:hypothetical protein